MTETVKNWVDTIGARRVVDKGIVEAAKAGADEISKGINVFNEASKGNRALAFKRVGAIGVGGVIALGALKGKDAEGNDRNGLVRLGQAVLGTGLAAGGLLAGGR